MAGRSQRALADPAHVAALERSLSALPMEQRRDVAAALELPGPVRRTIVEALADALVVELVAEGHARGSGESR
jgi:hypothetical protein